MVLPCPRVADEQEFKILLEFGGGFTADSDFRKYAVCSDEYEGGAG
jgi:hypothetical protein